MFSYYLPLTFRRSFLFGSHIGVNPNKIFAQIQYIGRFWGFVVEYQSVPKELETESVPESKKPFWRRPLTTAIKLGTAFVLLGAAGVITFKAATILRSV